MKKFFLLLTAFLVALPLSVFAKAHFSQDGFYFNPIQQDGKIVSVYVTRDDHCTSTDDEYNYSYLKGSISIPATVKSGKSEWPVRAIGAGAFANKKHGAETHITFPGSVRIIEYDAFRNATSLRSVTLNEGITRMGSGVFQGCDHLSSVYIPTTLKEIPIDAFYECSSLTTINIPATIHKIRSGAFVRCTGLETVEGPLGLVWVDTLEMEAFYGCSKLKSIRLTIALKKIGYSAFNGCSSLESIQLPANLEKIDDYAFKNSGLRNVTNYCPTPQTISANVFEGVNLSLCVLTVPKGSKTAYKNANVWKKFGQIIEVGEKAIPAGEKQVGDLYYELHQDDMTATLIYNDSYLSLSGKVSVPSDVTSGDYTYHVNKIASEVFKDCNKITSVALPSSVTKIPSAAFMNCSALTTITFSAALDSIMDSAFHGCSSLQTPTLPSTLKHIGSYAFSECTSLTYMNIPGGVSRIPNHCFVGCSKMNHLYLNEGLSSIYASAFAQTILTTLQLPSTLTEIQGKVFDGCSTLKTLRSMNPTPPTAEATTFNGIDVTNCYLYVPAGSLSDYATDTYWSAFTYKQEKSAKGREKIGDFYYDLKEDWTAAVTYEKYSDENNYKDLVGEITIPDYVDYNGVQYKVNAIGGYAFMNSKNIGIVNLPEHIDRIEVRAFANTNVYQINIPATISYLYNLAFDKSAIWTSYMDEKHAVYFNGLLLYHEHNYINGPFEVKPGTRLIAANAFSGDNSITEVHLPEGVTTICDGAIDWMPLLQVVSLPSTISYIGKGFINYTSIPYMKTIYNYMEEPYMAEGLFEGWGAEDKAKVTLYVPAGTKAAYEGTDVWGDFNIVEMEPIYTVVFQDMNGKELKTEKRQKGENATPPEAPNVEGYTFTGWDKSYEIVKSDLTIKAQFKQNESSGGGGDSGGGSDSGSGDKEDDKGNKDDKGEQDDDSKGLNDVPADNTQPTKVLRDGQLFILYNGRMYDIQGKETK